MRTWLRLHGQACAEALRHFGRAPGSFLLNIAVIAVALALPFAGLTLLDNIRPLSSELAVEPEVSIFLAADTPRERASALGQEIRRLAQQAATPVKLEFVPKERALSALKDRAGMGDAILALGENPLPDSYVLRLADVQSAEDARRVEILAAQLKAVPGVDYVQIDSAWVQRLGALVQLLRLALLLLATTLAVVVIAVVFNTIRLQVLTQREEIVVSRLFGATDAYVCRPFYYTGALLGFSAGVLGLAAVALSLQPLNAAVADLARLYASPFRLAPLGLSWSAALLAASATLGLFGAAWSVRRQLNRLG